MRSHNRKDLSGIPSLVLEGIAIDPSLHGNGIYRRILSEVHKREAILCLRTQNPRIYAALEGYCNAVYPGKGEMPGAIREIQKSLASDFGCRINERRVIKGYYGSLFYDKEPLHERISPFFKDNLGMDLHKGDAVLLVGVK